jgi:hypothetical protein
MLKKHRLLRNFCAYLYIFSSYLIENSIITKRSILCKGHSMSSEPNFQHSDPRMKLSICEAKIMNSFGDFFQKFKKVGFLKIQISKIF